MNDIVRSIPGTPIISKVAKTLDEKMTDPRLAINYVGQVYGVYHQMKNEDVNVSKENETKVVSKGDIEEIMIRKLID